LPLHKMLQAVHLLCSSKKGFSAHQLHRILEVDYKTGWFLGHRIREAMRDGVLAPMGGLGKIVESDETYIGKITGAPQRLSWGRHRLQEYRPDLGGARRFGSQFSYRLDVDCKHCPDHPPESEP
jgi:hypothetical protein